MDIASLLLVLVVIGICMFMMMRGGCCGMGGRSGHDERCKQNGKQSEPGNERRVE
jgi:hypothetical protein